MKQYQMLELIFPAPVLQNGYAQPELWADFSMNGVSTTVHGFYVSPNKCMVRFLPARAGTCTYTINGFVHAYGTLEIEPADTHGMVQTMGKCFCYRDGTPFLPVGTTVYALAHQPDALVNRTIATLATAPFNKVRMCVFPKSFDYNHNEPPFYPFEKAANGHWDVTRPCFAFWDRFESILKRITALDIQVDLILFHPYDRWGFASLTQEENFIYLDYLLRRLSAMPGLWWSMANEYDLCPAKKMDDWCALEDYIAAHDPYHHLLSCHNCFAFWDANRPNITHASLQVKSLSRVPEWKRQFADKPVIVDECCYEGNLPAWWGNLSGQDMLRRFWETYVGGGYATHGECFLDEENEVVFWAKGGKLKGKSVSRIAFLRSFFEQLVETCGPVEPIWSIMDEVALAEGDTLPPQIAERLRNDETGRGFFDAMLRNTALERARIGEHEHQFRAQCGDRAYLAYYTDRCPGEDTLTLAADKTWHIELIDTWAMTRKTLAAGVNGTVRVKLPGRPYLALLATAEET